MENVYSADDELNAIYLDIANIFNIYCSDTTMADILADESLCGHETKS